MTLRTGDTFYEGPHDIHTVGRNASKTKRARILAVLVSAAMPAAAERLWTQVGMTSPLDAARLPAAAAWGGLQQGTATKRGEALFPRLDG